MTGFSTSGTLDHITRGGAECDMIQGTTSGETRNSDWLSGSLCLFHVIIDKLYSKTTFINLKIVFIAIFVTSSWRNTPWRMSISFSTGVWRTAILVLKHSNFVSPHEMKMVSHDHAVHENHFSFFPPIFNEKFFKSGQILACLVSN